MREGRVEECAQENNALSLVAARPASSVLRLRLLLLGALLGREPDQVTEIVHRDRIGRELAEAREILAQLRFRLVHGIKG